MLTKKEEKKADDFWREYEEKTGEKVLARGLGKYIAGWEEFDAKKYGGIWGLLITTSGGFRFHHFPQNGWFDFLIRYADAKQEKEKTLFIPNENIISSESIKETKWWKKIFTSSQPLYVIKYTDEGTEKKIRFEADAPVSVER